MAYTESWSGKINRKLIKTRRIIDVAADREKADLVLNKATRGVMDVNSQQYL